VQASGSRAEGIKCFAGYTRPGSPANRMEAGGKILLAVDDKAGKLGIGGTVYFMVFDRADSAKGDTWGTGWKDFDATFRPGRDAEHAASPALDSSVRYLYLYQVVNDRKTLGSIKACSVQLVVDQRWITSWGHFSGVSLAVEFAGKEGKGS